MRTYARPEAHHFLSISSLTLCSQLQTRAQQQQQQLPLHSLSGGINLTVSKGEPESGNGAVVVDAYLVSLDAFAKCKLSIGSTERARDG